MADQVTKLVERLNELSPAERERLVENFLVQMESDDEFDRLVASRPDVLRAMADSALAEHRAGLTEPLTDADFALDADS